MAEGIENVGYTVNQTLVNSRDSDVVKMADWKDLQLVFLKLIREW